MDHLNVSLFPSGGMPEVRWSMRLYEIRICQIRGAYSYGLDAFCTTGLAKIYLQPLSSSPRYVSLFYFLLPQTGLTVVLHTEFLKDRNLSHLLLSHWSLTDSLTQQKLDLL